MTEYKLVVVGGEYYILGAVHLLHRDDDVIG